MFGRLDSWVVSHSALNIAMPWAMISSLGDDKLFFGPKHNIYTFFMILCGLFDLILLFVCQISHVNCETENWRKNHDYVDALYGVHEH